MTPVTTPRTLTGTSIPLPDPSESRNLYAPCSAAPGQGFQVVVVLPRGTNGPKPAITPINSEDDTLWACNKWLLAHADSSEAAQGAPVRLAGINVDIAADL